MSAEPKYARAIRVIGIGLVMTFIAIGLGTLLECRPFELYCKFLCYSLTSALKSNVLKNITLRIASFVAKKNNLYLTVIPVAVQI